MTNNIDFSAYYICLAAGENSLFSHLLDMQKQLTHPFHLEITGLHTGDILIGYLQPDYSNDAVTNNFISKSIEHLKPLVLIERKTIADFCQSLKSQHYLNQKSRMISFRDQTNCRCTLVVEGYFDDRDLSPNICNTPISTLEQAFTSIEYRDNFIIHHVENTFFHADYILKILKSHQKYNLHTTNYSSVDSNLKKDFVDSLKARKKSNIDPDVCFLLMLSNIPDISTNIAEKIALSHPNMKSLLSFLETNGPDALATLQLNKNKLGKIKSQKIYNYLIKNTVTP